MNTQKGFTTYFESYKSHSFLLNLSTQADGIMIPRYYLTYLCSKSDKQDLKPGPVQPNQENRG